MALGLLPVQVIAALNAVTRELLGVALGQNGEPWWLLAPLPGRQASYGPLAFLVVGALIIGVTLLVVRSRYQRRVRRGPAWTAASCAWIRACRTLRKALASRSAISSSRSSFITRQLPGPFDLAPRYRVAVADRIWRLLYEPIGTAVQRAAAAVAVLQQGRISTYLLYSFITLLVLLALML